MLQLAKGKQQIINKGKCCVEQTQNEKKEEKTKCGKGWRMKCVREKRRKCLSSVRIGAGGGCCFSYTVTSAISTTLRKGACAGAEDEGCVY